MEFQPDPNGPKMFVYQDEEELPEEFQSCVNGDPSVPLGVWFHHPYYVSMMPLVLPMSVEEFMEKKGRMADDAYAERNWGHYLMLHERGWRMERLLEIAENESFETEEDQRAFWDTAGWVWRDAELAEDAPEWTALLDANVPGQHFIMDKADREVFDALSGDVQVYRGVQAKTRTQALKQAYAGWSWTLDRETGKFFAKRFLRPPDRGWIVSAVVAASDILAYMGARGEAEVLIRPGTTLRAVTATLPNI